MRTLLIDNYDSFIYNLCQYLAACNAEPPIVLRNNEMSWDEVEHLRQGRASRPSATPRAMAGARS